MEHDPADTVRMRFVLINLVIETTLTTDSPLGMICVPELDPGEKLLAGDLRETGE